MLPFILPLLMAAGGAGLGALTNKKNRGKGALMGGIMGALGGAGLGAAGVGAGAAAAGGAASTAGTAGAAAGGLKGLMTTQNLMKIAPLMGNLMGGGQQEPEMPPMMGMGAQPLPIADLSPGAGRPMAPPVQTNLPYRMPQGGSQWPIQTPY